MMHELAGIHLKLTICAALLIFINCYGSLYFIVFSVSGSVGGSFSILRIAITKVLVEWVTYNMFMLNVCFGTDKMLYL